MFLKAAFYCSYLHTIFITTRVMSPVGTSHQFNADGRTRTTRSSTRLSVVNGSSSSHSSRSFNSTSNGVDHKGGVENGYGGGNVRKSLRRIQKVSASWLLSNCC